MCFFFRYQRQPPSPRTDTRCPNTTPFGPVNPAVDAGTNAKISTGRADSKFGIDAAQARDFLLANRDIPGIRIEGLAVHIGSQLTDIAPYRLASERLIALYKATGRASWRERACQDV